MSSSSGLTPKDLVATIRVLLRHHRGEWVSPKQLWDWIEGGEPDLAEQVRQKVKGYKDPARNNAVWFVSRALPHLEHDPSFRVSNTTDVPEMKDNAFWLIAHAE